MNVHEVKSIETKSILSRLKSKDNYWGIAYNMNLYRGCQHGCIYCDTRSCCYGIGDISHISVKKNALELLDHELGTKRQMCIRDRSLYAVGKTDEADWRCVGTYCQTSFSCSCDNKE